MKEVIENVRELEKSKTTFVSFDNVINFLRLCKVVGIVALGGAFNQDMTGQWFYC